MTSKQYYKQTSDMAFTIDDWNFENNCVKANVQLNGRTEREILDANDFFAIKGFDDKIDDCDLDTVEFEITFVHNSNHYTVYSMNVCDVIDCSSGGGEIVFSCDEYVLVDDVSLDNATDKAAIQKDGDKTECNHHTCANCIHIPSMPTLFDYLDCGFNDFPDIDKFFDDMSKSFDSLRKSGNTFCSVSYNYDGEGNGHYRKVDNNGVVEKFFKKTDNGMVETTTPPTDVKKVEIKDDNPNPNAKGKKTELKDILQ